MRTALYLRTTEVLAAIRKKKSERSLSAGAFLERVVVRCGGDLAQTLGPALADLQAASRADALEFVTGAEFDVEVFPRPTDRRRRSEAHEDGAVSAARSGALSRDRAPRAGRGSRAGGT